MSEKIEFRSGELLTASNLNNAFNEKLNAQSVNDEVTIDIENSHSITSTSDFAIDAATELELHGHDIIIDTNFNGLCIEQSDKSQSVSEGYECNIKVDAQGIHFDRIINVARVNTNYLDLNGDEITTSNAHYRFPYSDGEGYTLTVEDDIDDLKDNTLIKLVYKVSKLDNTSTLEYNVVDPQGEGYDNLAKLFEHIRDLIHLSLSGSDYTTDRIYLAFSTGNSYQYLKFSGCNYGFSQSDPDELYFNNSEYKIKLSYKNNSYSGLVTRTGFKSASVVNIGLIKGDSYEEYERDYISTDAESKIGAYINDNGQIVKSLSFHLTRHKNYRPHQWLGYIEVPIATSDGFPLYEGNSPTLVNFKGIGEYIRDDFGIIASNRLININLDRNATYIRFYLSWNTDLQTNSFFYDNKSGYESGRGLETVIYAEWI